MIRKFSRMRVDQLLSIGNACVLENVLKVFKLEPARTCNDGVIYYEVCFQIIVRKIAITSITKMYERSGLNDVVALSVCVLFSET